MARPITLFTGQWADLPFEEVARLAGEWGYDGLEIACWGDHFDPWAAVEDDSLRRGPPRDPGQARPGRSTRSPTTSPARPSATTRSTSGTRAILPGPGVGRRRAGGRAAARRRGDEGDRAGRGEARAWTPSSGSPGRRSGRPWRCSRRCRSRWSTTATATSPTAGTRSSTCSTRSACGSRTRCTPREIAYDYWTTVAALEAVGHREAFGLNWDPSHFVWQDLDPVGFLWDFQDRIYHVDCKDAKRQVGNGRNGRMGSHLAWADPRRGWDFVSTGHGDVPWEACFRMLNTIGYDGPISIEWEDAGMDRLVGAPEALAFVKRHAFDPPVGGVRRRVQQRLVAARRRAELQQGHLHAIPWQEGGLPAMPALPYRFQFRGPRRVACGGRRVLTSRCSATEAALVAGMVAGEADPTPADSRRRWRRGRHGAGAMSTLAEGRRVAANLRAGISGPAAGAAARGLRRLLDADAVALGGLHGRAGVGRAARRPRLGRRAGRDRAAHRRACRARAALVALPLHVRDELAGVLVVAGPVAAGRGARGGALGRRGAASGRRLEASAERGRAGRAAGAARGDLAALRLQQPDRDRLVRAAPTRSGPAI